MEASTELKARSEKKSQTHTNTASCLLMHEAKAHTHAQVQMLITSLSDSPPASAMSRGELLGVVEVAVDREAEAAAGCGGGGGGAPARGERTILHVVYEKRTDGAQRARQLWCYCLAIGKENPRQYGHSSIPPPPILHACFMETQFPVSN